MSATREKVLGDLRSRFPENFHIGVASLCICDVGVEPSGGKTSKLTNVELCEGIVNVLEKKGFLHRSFDLSYWDLDCKTYIEVEDDTVPEDVGDNLKFCLTFDSIEATFHHTRFLNLARSKLKEFKLPPGVQHPFTKLRFPQEAALLHMQKVMPDAEPGTRFMVVLPTGCGKTFITALVPYMLDATKVLIILPTKQLSRQIFTELTKVYSERHAIGFTGCKQYAQPKLLHIKDKEYILGPDINIVVTHIQFLAKGERSKNKAQVHDDDAEEEEKASDEVESEEPNTADKKQLHPDALALFQKFKPDLVNVDEAHHDEAASWRGVRAATFEHNNQCKYILQTATPLRGDGRKYGLRNDTTEGMEHYYIYPRKDAEIDKYIKKTIFHPVQVSFGDKCKGRCYEDQTYCDIMITAAVETLRVQRDSCDGVPFRMLVTTRRKQDAESGAERFNELSSAHGWKLHAAHINGDVPTDQRDKLLMAFSVSAASDLMPGERLIDVMFQCELLGEGYDNPWISVSTFLNPALSVGKLGQYNGRAIRTPPLSAFNNARVLPVAAMQAHMFYPDFKNVRDIVDEYEAERMDKSILFADSGNVYDSFKSAHLRLGKKTTAEGVKELKENYKAGCLPRDTIRV